MKKLLFILLLTGKTHAMEPAAQEIASTIAGVIEAYDKTSKADDADFTLLVKSYFTRESLELEERIMPHFSEKLKLADSQIDELIKSQDKSKLESFISGLITESLEDAFKAQSDHFAELKALADEKLQKTRYALITAIVTTILSIGGIAVTLYLK